SRRHFIARLIVREEHYQLVYERVDDINNLLVGGFFTVSSDRKLLNQISLFGELCILCHLQTSITSSLTNLQLHRYDTLHATRSPQLCEITGTSSNELDRWVSAPSV